MRARIALALGVGLYLVAWAFGSKPLYPVAIGLVAVALAARLWVRFATRPMRLSRTAGEGEHFEGDDVEVSLRLEHDGPVVPGRVVVHERVGRVGVRDTALARAGASLVGRYVLRALPRGRYTFDDARASIEDPFGLSRTEVQLAGSGAVLVYPHIAELDALFSDHGGFGSDGRRLLLRRASGFDLHSVREYERGESLRKVHWPSTAKRSRLMVKELEDAPRDEVAVVLDADASTVVGTAPDSSFELQVRAAASLLAAQTRRGRRTALVVNDETRETRRVVSHDGDWRHALELLAAVEPSGRTPVSALLADEAGTAARALELLVVTAARSRDLIDALHRRSQGAGRVALVLVDAASFAGDRRAALRDPGLLRLQAAGVALAVLRRGDDLAEKLGAARGAEAARG